MFGDVGRGETWSGGSDSAYLGAFDVEAVAEECEHLLDVLPEGSADLFSELGSLEAGLAADATGGVGLMEEDADLSDDGALAAEVDGALPAVFAPGEAVVGSEAATAVGAPCGDDGALGGEACGVIGEELDGGVALRGRVHVYSIRIWQDFSIEELNSWGGFWRG